MKQKCKWLYSVIAGILTALMFCSSVSAVDLVDSIQHEVAIATEFPLEIVVDNSVEMRSLQEDAETAKKDSSSQEDVVSSEQSSERSDEISSSINENDVALGETSKTEDTPTNIPLENRLLFKLKNDFMSYEQYSLEVLHYANKDHILSELYDQTAVAELHSVEESQNYPIYVKLYNAEHIRNYEGAFTLTSTGKVSVIFKETEIKPNFEKYTKPDDGDKVPELTDEQYNEIYSKLEIPSFINEEDAKKAKHIKRLEEFNDSYDTIGYRNVDGTNTIYLFSSPVRYKDKNGKIKDAETNVKETEQSQKDQGYSYMNDFGELESYFAKSLSNSKGIKIKKKDLEFEFGFSVGDNKKGLLEEAVSTIAGVFTQKDNKATLKENKKQQKIEYKKANNKKNTIETEPTMNGAKQTLVLEQAPKNNKVTPFGSTPNN